MMGNINNQQQNQRDYDKEPIIIKDYGAYFQLGLLMLLFVVVIILWIGDFQDGRFERMNFYSFEFFRIIVVVISIFWFIYFLYRLPRNFQQRQSFFKFNNQNLQYVEYKYDSEGVKTDFNLSVKSIKQVSFCIVSELQNRYGRWHYLTSWQLYRKSSIGVHIGKTTLFVRYLLTYILFVLPYKIYRLLKAKEPLRLLFKNLFIQFDNRNYLLVNIYSQQDLDELEEYFKVHNISITNKVYFIPHLQNHGWFVDKNEVWSDEFNQKEEEK